MPRFKETNAPANEVADLGEWLNPEAGAVRLEGEALCR